MIQINEVQPSPGASRPPLPMIFILGNSHSGSTLLSFLLAAHPDVINLGEVKSKTWEKDRFCSCGLHTSKCPFYNTYLEEFNTLKKTGLSKLRNTSPLSYLFRSNIRLNADASEAVQQLFHTLQSRILHDYPAARYWIDASKSVWMLNAWMQVIDPEMIRIIWVKRARPATVYSFMKRGHHFLSSLLSIWTNDKITQRFLQKNKLPFLQVNFDDFYTHYPEVAREMSTYLNLDIPVSFASHHNHHVISGNRPTRLEFMNGFNGLRADVEWKSTLSSWQKKVITWMS